MEERETPLWLGCFIMCLLFLGIYTLVEFITPYFHYKNKETLKIAPKAISTIDIDANVIDACFAQDFYEEVRAKQKQILHEMTHIKHKQNKIEHKLIKIDNKVSLLNSPGEEALVKDPVAVAAES